jgi:predicted Zn-dependent protease
MAELKQMDRAEKALRNVLKNNKTNASAAYNLAIIVSAYNLTEACELSRIAYESEPEQAKYGYSYAYFLAQTGMNTEAIKVLGNEIKAHPEYASSLFLLINIYETEGNVQQAIYVCENAIESNLYTDQINSELKSKLIQLKAQL